MPDTVNIKGIRIRTLNLIMLCLSLILFGIILYTTFLLRKEYSQFVSLVDRYITWERAAHQIHMGSDNLTEQSRLFTLAGKKKFVDNYFYELHSAKTSERAIDFLEQENLHPENNANLQNALNLSKALTTHEIYAMRLIAEANRDDLSTYPAEVRDIRLSARDRTLSPEEKRERGRQLLFSDEYLSTKSGIMGMLNELISENLASAEAQQRIHTRKLGDLLSEQRAMLVALCVLNILTFAMVIILVVKPLQSFLRCIRDDQMLKILGAFEFRQLGQTYNKMFLLKEKHDQMLKHKAEHDPLTGLLNRSAFESLSHLMACEQEAMALILIDVDKFKEINDNYGHETGDEALKKVASLLKHNFRSNDMSIRLGGDEFAVVLQGELPNYRKLISEKIEDINHTLQNPVQDFPRLSISVGVAYSADGFSDDLYAHADIALYKVKEAGRCGCRFYEDCV